MGLIVKYPGTAILYTAVVLLCFILSSYPSKIRSANENNIRAKFQISAIIMILTLLSGLRGSSVGLDTWGYIRIIEANGEWATITDRGFVLLIKVTRVLLGKNPQIVLFLIAFLINFFIVKALFDMGDICDFRFALFVYLTTFYFLTFSGIRQWLSVAIISYAIKYIRKEKYVTYIIWVLIASTFHLSALLGMLNVPLIIFFTKKDYLPKRTKKLHEFGILLFPVVCVALGWVYANLVSKYSHWISEEYERVGEFGTMYIGLILLFVLICSYILFFKKQYAIEGQSIYFLLPIGIFALLTHIFAGIIGLYIRNIGRVEWCFSIGCCMLYASFFGKSVFVSKGQIGAICKTGIKFLLILFCIYEFYYMLNNGGSGQVPYVLFGEFR